MNPFVFLPVKHKSFRRVDFTDIFFIESDDHYAKIMTHDTSYRISLPLAQIEAQLPPDLFCRVHRTYIVQISRILYLNDDSIQLSNNKVIPLSRQYRENLFNRVKMFK